MISTEKEQSFPLIELPPTVRFADITKAVSDELLRRQTALLHDNISVNQMLLQTITEGASLEDLAQRVREIAGGSVLLVDTINQRQAYNPSETDAVRLQPLTHRNPRPVSLPVGNAAHAESRPCKGWKLLLSL